jgi:hypothetical protein
MNNDLEQAIALAIAETKRDAAEAIGNVLRLANENIAVLERAFAANIAGLEQIQSVASRASEPSHEPKPVAPRPEYPSEYPTKANSNVAAAIRRLVSFTSHPRRTDVYDLAIAADVYMRGVVPFATGIGYSPWERAAIIAAFFVGTDPQVLCDLQHQRLGRAAQCTTVRSLLTALAQEGEGEQKALLMASAIEAMAIGARGVRKLHPLPRDRFAYKYADAAMISLDPEPYHGEE